MIGYQSTENEFLPFDKDIVHKNHSKIKNKNQTFTAIIHHES